MPSLLTWYFLFYRTTNPTLFYLGIGDYAIVFHQSLGVGANAPRASPLASTKASHLRCYFLAVKYKSFNLWGIVQLLIRLKDLLIFNGLCDTINSPINKNLIKQNIKGEYGYEKSMFCIGTDTYIIYAL